MVSSDALIGKKLGDYLIQGVLGTGGMAKVYRGYDERLNRYSAVKVIEPQLVASADEDEYRERFLREARAIAQLRHVRVVGIYQFGQLENLYYIAMEYVEGRNLREILKSYIKQQQLMPVDDVLSVLADIADALDYAHKQNIIHRDVKPSNIIVTDTNNGVLTDFGLALNAIEGTIGNTFGSVHYIAPEQAISSANSVPASDQYSLAIVAFEMLTGRVPFDDASAMSVALKHISDAPPSLKDFNPLMSPNAERVVMKALDKDASKRYPNCKAFVQALREAFEAAKRDDSTSTSVPGSTLNKVSDPTTPRPFPVPSFAPESPTISEAKRSFDLSKEVIAPPSVSSSRNWVVGIVAVVLLVAIVAGLIFMSNQPTPPATTVAVADESITQTAQAFEIIATQLVVNVTATAQAAQTRTAIAQATQTAESTDEGVVSIDNTEEATAESTRAVDTTQEATVTEEASNTPRVTQEAEATNTPRSSNSTVVANVATETNTPVIPTETSTSRPTNTDIPPTKTNTAIASTDTNTPSPEATNTPDLVFSEGEIQNMVLRYDGRSIILQNIGARSVFNVSDLRFILFEPDGNGNFTQTRLVFDATEWGSFPDGLGRQRCLQLWTTDYSNLPMDEPPADSCESRLYFRQTVRPFWVSEQYRDGAYFEVRLGRVDVLATCPANLQDTRNELRCAFELR
jgi:serine/threonine protein kinase